MKKAKVFNHKVFAGILFDLENGKYIFEYKNLISDQ